jgi:DNA-binding NarL/FixJ family response regulator
VTAPIRVLLADDHPPTRAGVRAALEGRGFEICAEVGDAPSAIESALAEKPDVCLLDIRMPGNGISAAVRIGELLPDTAIVMLTVSRDDADLFDALKAGASGYLLKDIDPERLALALNGVLSGEAALPRNLVARLVGEFRAQAKRRRIPLRGQKGVDLTAREWEVLDLLREDKTTEEIAERLFVAPVTVRTHVSSILKKLRVNSRAEAVKALEDDPER